MQIKIEQYFACLIYGDPHTVFSVFYHIWKNKFSIKTTLQKHNKK